MSHDSRHHDFFRRAMSGFLSLLLSIGMVPLGAVPAIAEEPPPVPNQPPVATDNTYATDEDTPLSVPGEFGPLFEDSDPDGDTLTYTATLAVAASGAEVNLMPDGGMEYCPLPDWCGIDSFAYEVTDGRDGFASATVWIEVLPVNDPPIADAGGPYTMEQGGPLTLDGTGSYDPDPGDSITSYEWDLDGDGLFDDAVGPTPDATAIDYYHIDSFFDVWLRVTDSVGEVGIDKALVVVTNLEPSIIDFDVHFDPGSEPFEEHVYAATATFTDPGASDTHTATIDWGDGTGDQPATVAEPVGGMPGSVEATHAYGSHGTYVVTLTVTDDEGGTAIATCEVTVTNLAPVAEAGGPYEVVQGGTLTLDGSGSFDPDPGDSIVSWEWDLDGDGLFDDETGPAPTVDAYDLPDFPAESFFDVYLRVTDGFGDTNVDAASVLVHNVAPEITSTYFDPGSEPFEGQVVTFRATFTDPGAYETHTATIDWGDGTAPVLGTVTEPAGETEGSVEATHAYADAGEGYHVTLSLSDDNGGTAGADAYCSALPYLDVLEPSGLVISEEGAETYVLVAIPDLDLDDLHLADIDWGDGTPLAPMDVTESDGTTEASAEATHTYAEDGVYNATAYVTDDDGASDSVTFPVTVQNVAPTITSAYFDPGPYLLEGQLVTFRATFTDPGIHDTHTATIDWGDGTVTEDPVIVEPNSPEGTIEATHTYEDNPFIPGDLYVMEIETKDDDAGLVMYWDSVHVQNAPPVITPGPNVEVETGQEAPVKASFTDAGTKDTHTGTVDPGDGSGSRPAKVTEPKSPGSVEATCTYDTPGTYTVTLTVEDDEGAVDTCWVTVTVLDLAPVAEAGGPYEVVQGDPLTLDGSGSFDPDPGDSIVSWEWDLDGDLDFDDAFGPTPTVAAYELPDFPAESFFDVWLRVTDGFGETDSDSASVVVHNVAPTITSAYFDPGSEPFEGQVVTFRATFTDPGVYDTHTATIDWGDGTPPEPAKVTEPNSPEGSVEATHTYEDDTGGPFLVTLTVEDDVGYLATCESVVTVLDSPPVMTPGPDVEVDTGQEAPVKATFTDAGTKDTHTGTVDPGDGSGSRPAKVTEPKSPGSVEATCTYDTPGTYPVTLTVTDDDGGTASCTVLVTVENPNEPPVILPGTWTAPTDPVSVGITVDASVAFTDANEADTHSAQWDWGDGSSSEGSIVEQNGSGTVFGTHDYGLPGVYTLTLTVTDEHGASATAFYQYVVVYDPSAGFVTGAGWIESPAGAYVPDPTLSGRATFGFVSRYSKGASVPNGNSHFMFRAAGLEFTSTSYDWLVIAGYKAKFKGTGTLNGLPGYGFMITAIDNERNPLLEDGFRIKIWEVESGLVVYDNQLGELDDTAAATDIGAGNIVIHTKK